jgi:HEPN domain-containing protein
MNRKLLQRLARERTRDARALLKEKQYSGAYYLSGYAVECALKACIAKSTNRHDFPDLAIVKKCYTHDLGELLKLAGLSVQRDTDMKADDALAVNWTVTKDWSEQSRYATHAQQKAEDLFRAVTDRQHGVLKWLKTRW